jgi:aryl-phospho-beta-D-glucosidase BglC (GH1 family)
MSYGCPATLDSSPIGGGAGYQGLIFPSDARYIVGTAPELKSALALSLSGQIVYLADGARILITADPATYYSDQYRVHVPAGVTLAGGRGRAGVTGGIIQLDAALHSHSEKHCIRLAGADAIATGLTVIGTQDGETGQDYWAGILCGPSSIVDNNEIHGFGYAGAEVHSGVTNVWVHHNYIHHCQQHYTDAGAEYGLGYGVVINSRSLTAPSSALVEGNKLDYCRHYIAGQEGRVSYTFRYNYLLGHCLHQEIDMHGNHDPGTYCSGEFLEIYNNTSLQANSTFFVRIRGIPYAGGWIKVHHNLSPNVSPTAIIQEMGGIGGNPSEWNAPTHTSFVQMVVADNWMRSTPPPSDVLKKMAVSVSVQKQGAATTTWGMNLDGLQFTPETIHGQYGYQYIKPTTTELDYFRSKRMTVFRLGFMWERVQHALYSDLDPTDIGYLDDVVNAAIARGLQVYICPFNYGRYRNASTQVNSILGSIEVPNAAFADLWTKLASHFKGRVWGYDLMNEPHDMGGAAIWKNAAQAATSAIRAVDSATPIIIPGYGWSSAWGWDTWAGSDDLKTLIDPGNNLIFAAHQYFDSDTTGTYKSTDPLPANPLTRGEALLSPFINWLRANGKRGLIGEIGVPSDQFWLDVLKPTLDYLAASKDVLTSIQLHTAGPWWPASYTMCLDPYTDGSDKPQMVLLGNYIR